MTDRCPLCFKPKEKTRTKYCDKHSRRGEHFGYYSKRRRYPVTLSVDSKIRLDELSLLTKKHNLRLLDEMIAKFLINARIQKENE